MFGIAGALILAVFGIAFACALLITIISWVFGLGPWH